jgi:hypothetical protein
MASQEPDKPGDKLPSEDMPQVDIAASADKKKRRGAGKNKAAAGAAEGTDVDTTARSSCGRSTFGITPADMTQEQVR